MSLTLVVLSPAPVVAIVADAIAVFMVMFVALVDTYARHIRFSC